MKKLLLLVFLAGCTFTFAPEPTARIVTFGDSNVDLGFIGDSIAEASYISPNYTGALTTSDRTPHSLAGKIKSYSSAKLNIQAAVNHGLAGTNSGSDFKSDGTPNALALYNGVTRFEAEVLGLGFPWDGGTGKVRSYAFTPTKDDFVFVSTGTNDPDPEQGIKNIRKMVDMWTAKLPASHFIITTLPPNTPFPHVVGILSDSIRALASEKGLTLIDLEAHVSSNGEWLPGVTKDGIHYNEAVRDWLAIQVVAKMKELSSS